jgi:hypothetical protein
MSFCAVGSRVTCSPPPTDTDEDWLVLIEETETVPLQEYLIGDGWATPSLTSDQEERYSGSEVKSWKKMIDGTLVNLIITHDYRHYDKFLALSSVAARLNLTDKADRAALFRAGLASHTTTLPDGNGWSNLNPERPQVETPHQYRTRNRAAMQIEGTSVTTATSEWYFTPIPRPQQGRTSPPPTNRTQRREHLQPNGGHAANLGVWIDEAVPTPEYATPSTAVDAAYVYNRMQDIHAAQASQEEYEYRPR